MRRTKQLAQRLPEDVLEGYEHRLTSVAIPSAKLPEIMELRAIGRQLIAHINALDEEQRLRMDLEGLSA